MLKAAVDRLAAGIPAGDFALKAGKISRGRFAEEINVDLLVSHGDHQRFLLCAKVFYGRPPHYRPWVELFGICERMGLGTTVIPYVDSPVEELVLSHFSQALGPGDHIFVEYHNDPETAEALKYNVPPPLTRLGYKLFRLGFTWFKDWYFPEGLMEGGQKLQAEKPVHGEAMAGHIRAFQGVARLFIEEQADRGEIPPLMKKARDRAHELLTKPTAAW